MDGPGGELPQTSLKGKVALVTGGSRGIGKAIAAAFAGAGARVMVTSRKAEACEAAAAEIGAAADWEAGHVGRPEDAERVIDATLERLGGLDILVNNAATNPHAGHAIDCDLPAWNKILEVNLSAPFIWTQLAWRKAMQRHGGVVLNMSSVGALGTHSILGVYDLSKAALVHLTKQLAAELAPGVRVNALAPGLVKTDFSRRLWDEGRGERTAQAYPLQRLGEPEDVAAAALYLAADTGRWITGQTLVLDGGAAVAFSSLA